MRYFISDTHFFHKNIVRLTPLKRKPGFEILIIDNLKKVLKEEDELYLVGDFLWTLEPGFLELWKSVPGRKILIKGNHDLWFPEEELKPFFDEIVPFYTIIEVRGKKVLLSHYPARDLRTFRYRELQKEISEIYHSESCSLLIHGHVHWNRFGVFCGCHLEYVKCINVNVEFTNYRPISEKELPLW